MFAIINRLTQPTSRLLSIPKAMKRTLNSVAQSPNFVLHTAAPCETRNWGANCARVARSGDALLLFGQMSSGKSEFARGFVREATGDATLDVPSPTFVFEYSYPMSNGEIVRHFDLWRREQTEDLKALNIQEVFQDDICLVEWPEMLDANDVPESFVAFFFNVDEDQSSQRQVSIFCSGPNKEDLAQRYGSATTPWMAKAQEQHHEEERLQH